MKKALIKYHHGLGDIIQLTPHLRYLYNHGFVTDIIGMSQNRKSHMLDECPYVDKMIDIPNTWKSPLGFHNQLRKDIEYFKSISGAYDWIGMANHVGIGSINKIDFTSKELGLNIVDRRVEVFIPEIEEEFVINYVRDKYPYGYIHVHTFIEEHKYHDWDATSWIKENLPDLPIVDTGYKGNYFMWREDINASFVLMREATHRVLSSSVMVHACDAMGVEIDVVNYGRSDRKIWLDDMSKIRNIREGGNFL
jgi:hypothetical protein